MAILGVYLFSDRPTIANCCLLPIVAPLKRNSQTRSNPHQIKNKHMKQTHYRSNQMVNLKIISLMKKKTHDISPFNWRTIHEKQHHQHHQFQTKIMRFIISSPFKNMPYLHGHQWTNIWLNGWLRGGYHNSRLGETSPFLARIPAWRYHGPRQT